MSMVRFAALTVMLVRGAWSENRTRLVLTLLAVALGVALGTAVHQINYSAAAELTAAVRGLAGEADVTVRGGRAGFSEDWYPRLARRAGVATASPVLEIDAQLSDRQRPLRVLGLDPMRASTLQPALFGDAGEHIVDLLAPHTALITSAAAARFDLAAGEFLHVQVGTRRIAIRILGVLPTNEALTQSLALMDIASAQWAFDQLGVISRVELRLAPGTDRGGFVASLNKDLPAGVSAVATDVASAQGLALSRAYRVNLNMLALVSVFTGAVLVFATQTLTILRRRTHLALLDALGIPRRMLAALLVTEAGAIGVAGTAIGLVLGIAAAQLGLAHTAGDLGAGFFADVAARMHIDAAGLALIAMTGIAAAMLGGWIPAREVTGARTAAALRAGDEQNTLERLVSPWPGLAAFALGALLVVLPPIDGLPIAGYAAIACFLIGALLLVPACVRATLAVTPLPETATPRLAILQLRGATGFAGISLAAIVASFGVSVAMLIMIHSFRVSLDDWLQAALPADLYVRAGRAASTWIEPPLQARLRAIPGVERVVFTQIETLELDARKAPVTLLARDFHEGRPDALVLVAPARLPSDSATPAWVSEAIRDLYGADVGKPIVVPIAGRAHSFTVAGVWRDYVRPGGGIVIERAEYLRRGGDPRANEAWIWRSADAQPEAIAVALRSAVGADAAIEVREPHRIRELSLAAFDRTFAITYALQAVAITIGLFGISVGASAQATARRRELGMLLHLGMARRQLMRTIAYEGAILGGFGSMIGIGVGALLSAVLIQVINRQSFHWSMQTHFPWPAILSWAIVLAACAALTAALSARRAIGDDAVRAVKEDW